MSIQIGRNECGPGFSVSWFDKDLHRHTRSFPSCAEAEIYAAKLSCRQEIEKLLNELDFFAGIRSNAIYPGRPSSQLEAE